MQNFNNKVTTQKYKRILYLQKFIKEIWLFNTDYTKKYRLYIKLQELYIQSIHYSIVNYYYLKSKK